VKKKLVSFSIKAFALILTLCIISSSAEDSPKRSRRLAGGSGIPHATFPFIVSLQDSSGHFCAGTIISDSVILTAAHCTFRSEFSIRVGSTTAISGGTVHDILSIIRHKKYEKVEIEKNISILNDLALIKVTPPIIMSESVQKVQLFRQSETVANGSNGTLIGWGATRMRRTGDFDYGKIWDRIKSVVIDYDKSHYYSEILKQASVTIMSKEECIGKYPSTLLRHKFCAYSPQASGCIGDSGGPLMVEGRQAGIVSSGGNVCASGRSRGVYVKIASYRDWIDKNVKKLEPTAEKR
ncbi:hypothetical protein QAD02_005704, partial [Eretmocerus hayati]